MELSCDSENGACGQLGSASVSVLSGTPPYTYSWTNVLNEVVSTDATASGLVNGVYVVRVTDANGCTNTCTETIVNTLALVADCSSENGLCGGLGSASVSVSDGSGDYSYAWSNGGTTASISDLADGTYSVIVTDNVTGCTATCEETITNQLALVADCSSENGLCGGLGSASVSVSDGSGDYSYAWSNGATTASISGLADGTYSVLVTDNVTGCTANCEETITNQLALVADCSSENGLCGGLGSASVNVSDGSGDYSYAWSNGATTASISGLADGTYSVLVTDNVTGCTATCEETISNQPALSIACVPVNGGCGELGSGSVNILTGTGPYTYSWTNSGGEVISTDVSISDLADGIYSVIVTDANGCTDDCSATIVNQSDLVIDCSSMEAACGELGSVSVDVLSGTPPYSYSWTNAANVVISTDASVANLDAGTYTVSVSDANGCSNSCSTTITSTTPPLVDIACGADPLASIGGSNTTVENATGCGSLDYAFWTNNLLNAYGVDNHWSVIGGSFVENGGGTALFTGSFVNNDDSDLSFDFNVIFGGKTYAPPSGSPKESGGPCSADVDNTDWYYYTTTNGTLLGTGDLAGAVVNITRHGPAFQLGTGANENNMFVFGASGWLDCEVVSNPTTGPAFNANAGHCDFNIELPNGPQFGNETPCTTICSGGSVDLFATALPIVGSYSYLWSTGAITASITVSPTSTTVYSVLVTDLVTNCTTSTEITVTVNDAPEVTCIPVNGTCGNPGSASVDVSGGSGDYAYAWSNGENTPSISDLADGPYSVTVTDNETGCSASCEFNIENTPAVELSCDSENGACGQLGSASVSVLSGTPPYTYSWTNVLNEVVSTDATASGLVNGVYVVRVTDANGCTNTCTETIVNTLALVADCSSENGLCGSLGSASVSVSDGSGDYSYAWSNGGTTASISDLADGTYSVLVTDNVTGCTATCEETITNQLALVADCSSENGLCGGLGSASVSVSDGSGDYSYAWSNGATTASISGLADGTYSVLVTDNVTGCTANCEETITNQPALSIACVPVNGGCGELGSASVNILTGTGPYTYSWTNSGGEVISTDAVISSLEDGVYSVVVTDANGCSDDCSTTISTTMAPLVDIACGSDPLASIGGSNTTVENATGCGSLDYAFWTNNLLSAYGVDNHWSVIGGSFVENGGGTALFTGSFVNNDDSNLSFNFNVIFGGKTFAPPAGSPKESGGPCSQDVDNSDWYYYTTTNGTLLGTGDLAGAVVNITRHGPAFQLGTGANENNMSVFGASGWLDCEVVSNPTTGPAFNANAGHCDFNIELPDGPQFGNETPCTTICSGGSVDLFATALPIVGSYSYLWSTGETTESITVSPALTTEYSVVVSDGSCSSTAYITVTVEDCTPPVYDCPALEANIGDLCDDGDPSTGNDVVGADCVCAGTIIYDCPLLEANIGDPCNDGMANTENDMIVEGCGCEGTEVFDCEELGLNFGSPCDDGDPTTQNDVVGEDCICAGESLIPANDLPCDAISLECASSVSGSTEFATPDDEPTAFCGTTPGAPGVWYSIIGTGAETTVSLCGSDFDTKLNIYVGSCDALECITGNDDNFSACGAGNNSQLTFDAAVGTEYFIFVNGFSGAVGDFALAITCVEYECPLALANIGDACDDNNPATYNDVRGEDCGCAGTLYDCVDLLANIGDSCDDEDPTTIDDVVGTNCICSGTPIVLPENDDCADAIQLICGAEPLTFSSIGSQATNTTSCSMGSNGIWFSVVGTGGDIIINSTASFDHELSINTGTCELLENIGCDDQSVGAETYTISNSVLDQTYFIYVAHYSSSSTTTGDITMDIDCPEPPSCTAPSALSTSIIENCENGDGTFDVTVTLSQDGTIGDYVITNDYDPSTATIAIDGSAQFSGFPSGTTVNFTATADGFEDCTVSGSASFTCPPAVPENDECADATPIGCGAEVTGTTEGANSDSAPFCGTGDGSGGGVWYVFTPESDQIVTASLCGSSFDTKIRVFTGSCDALECVGGNDDACGTQSSVTFDSFFDVDYYILVHGFSSNQGEFVLNITCEDPPSCTAPSTLITSITENCENGDGTFDVTVTLSQDGTTGDYVITNDFDLSTATISIDGSALFSGFPSGTTVNFTASHEGFNDCNVSGSASFTCPPPALENDECDGAIALACNETLDATSVSATQSLAPVLCGGFTATAPVEDVWFSIEADGVSAYTISTDGNGGGFDAVLSIYSGTCDELAYITCADNTVTADPEVLETGILTAGTYYVRVYRYSGEGNFTISLDCEIPVFDCPDEQANYGDPCDDGDPNTVNDVIGQDCGCAGQLPLVGSTCETAIAVDCNAAPVTYSSVGSAAVNATSCSMGNNGIWFTFTGTGGDITVNSTASFDHEMSINSGSCGALSSIVCDDQSTGAETHLISSTVIGETYYVYIAHYSSGSSTTGDISIDIDCAEPPACTAPEMSLSLLDDALSPQVGCIASDAQYYVEVLLTGGAGNTNYSIVANGGIPLVIDPSVASGIVGPFAAGTTASIVATGVEDGDCDVSGTISPMVCPPANDTCEEAIATICGGSYSGTTTWATSDPTQTYCGPSGPSALNGGVWYSFVSEDATSVTLDLSLSSFDTKMWVYTGICGELTCLDGDDDGGTSTRSLIGFEADPGVEYLIYISGYSTARGAYTLEVSCESACIVGDPCDDGDANTINDVIQSDCTCAGVPVGTASIEGEADWNGSCGSRPAIIKLYDPNTGEMVSEYNTMINENGDFNVSINEVGTFDIVFKVSGYLSEAMPDHTIVAGSNTMICGALFPGDINNDNLVNMYDVSSMNLYFGSTIGDSNYNPLADFNCDGVITIIDISMLNTTFGMAGQTQTGN